MTMVVYKRRTALQATWRRQTLELISWRERQDQATSSRYIWYSFKRTSAGILTKWSGERWSELEWRQSMLCQGKACVQLDEE